MACAWAVAALVAAAALDPVGGQDEPSGRWDLKASLADKPKGAYLDLLRPLVRANLVTYWTSHGPRMAPGREHDSIPEDWAGGGNWTRMPEVERQPEEGVRLRVFVDASRRRALLAFGGEALDFRLEGTLVDICMMEAFRTGSLEQNEDLPPCPMKPADYFKSAVEAVREAREALLKLDPGFALLLTGHSLGGALALAVEAVLDFDAQVVALEAAVYGPLLLLELGQDVKRLSATADRVALFDPLDLARIRATFIEDMDDMFDDLDAKSAKVQHPGVTLCVYDQHPPPAVCSECAARRQKEDPAMEQKVAYELCARDPPALQERLRGKVHGQCHEAVQWLARYAEELLPSEAMPSSAVVPSCHAVNAPAAAGAPQAAASCGDGVDGDEVCAARSKAK